MNPDIPVKCSVCGSDKVELYKLKNEIWTQAGFDLREVACISCFEKRLGRDLTVSDLDLSFPWWGADRPEYYLGIREGITGHSTRPLPTCQSEYELGFELGGRIAKNYL